MPLDPALFPPPNFDPGQRVRFYTKAVGQSKAQAGTGTVLFEWLGIERMVKIRTDVGGIVNACPDIGDVVKALDD